MVFCPSLWDGTVFLRFIVFSLHSLIFGYRYYLNFQTDSCSQFLFFVIFVSFNILSARLYIKDSLPATTRELKSIMANCNAFFFCTVLRMFGGFAASFLHNKTKLLYPVYPKFLWCTSTYTYIKNSSPTSPLCWRGVVYMQLHSLPESFRQNCTFVLVIFLCEVSGKKLSSFIFLNDLFYLWILII